MDARSKHHAGTILFENTAHKLCGGKKWLFTDNFIYKNQVEKIDELMTDLKNSTVVPDFTREEKLLDDNAFGELKPSPDFTVDCFFKDSSKVVAIELKSVRPNSGETRGEKQKLMLARAALKLRFPGKRVFYFFGFPFDPLADTETGCDKAKFMHSMIEFTKFCAPEEILVADEFWRFLCGEPNAMAQILALIRAIATPDFPERFDYLCRPQNMLEHPAEYAALASEWNLYDEAAFARNADKLSASPDSRTRRMLNKCVFNKYGKYNSLRADALKNELLRTGAI